MADLTTSQALTAITEAVVDGHVEVRGVVQNPRANGRVTVMSWPLEEIDGTLAVADTITRVDDDPDGCRVHILTAGGRTYRFAAA